MRTQRSTRTRRTAAAAMVAALVLAACSGDDDSSSTTARDPADGLDRGRFHPRRHGRT